MKTKPDHQEPIFRVANLVELPLAFCRETDLIQELDRSRNEYHHIRISPVSLMDQAVKPPVLVKIYGRVNPIHLPRLIRPHELVNANADPLLPELIWEAIRIQIDLPQSRRYSL